MKCAVPQTKKDASFDEMRESFQSQSYWVRFFMRPCCPPPGEASARNLIDHLKSDVDNRADLTDAQRDELKDMADERLNWYLTLPVRHTA